MQSALAFRGSTEWETAAVTDSDEFPKGKATPEALEDCDEGPLRAGQPGAGMPDDRTPLDDAFLDRVRMLASLI